jgi:3-hydroxyacyl-CoA dehydrogenase
MGTGIAIVANRVAGLNVHVVDANEKSLDNSKKFIGKTID